MSETVIITLGHGANPDRKGSRDHDPATREAFVREVRDLVEITWGPVVAAISGPSASDWGYETATWLSVSLENAETLGATRHYLARIARRYDQAAIGVVFRGQFVEIEAAP